MGIILVIVAGHFYSRICWGSAFYSQLLKATLICSMEQLLGRLNA